MRRDPGAGPGALSRTPMLGVPFWLPNRQLHWLPFPAAQDPGFCWQRTPLPSSQEQGAARVPRSPARLRLSEAASLELQKGRREPLTCADPAFGAAAAATRELREPPGRGGPGHRGGQRDFLGPASRRPRLRAPPPPAPPPELGGGRAPPGSPGPGVSAPGAGRRSSAGCGEDAPPPGSGSVKSKRLRYLLRLS